MAAGSSPAESTYEPRLKSEALRLLVLGGGERPLDGVDQLAVHDRGAHPVPGGDDPALVEGHVHPADVRISGQEPRDQALDGRPDRSGNAVVDGDLVRHEMSP